LDDRHLNDTFKHTDQLTADSILHWPNSFLSEPPILKANHAYTVSAVF